MKGVNWLGIVLGLIAGQLVGFVWYAIVFETKWLALSGITPTEEAASTGMMYGALIALIAVVGLAIAIAKVGANTLVEGAKVGLFLALFFAATTVALDAAYAMEPLELLLIDAGYLIVYLTIAGALIGGIRLKAKVPAAA